jgi:hypothetical protein
LAIFVATIKKTVAVTSYVSVEFQGFTSIA